MAQAVVKTFDYYNTRIVLPEYSVPGYEKETDLSRAYYSADFSSNPIGSKVDFFVQLRDPCVAIYAPNPVFEVPVGLSGLSPQWFDGWWDDAMFYSHPRVKQQLTAANPDVYQDFSESVGSLSYVSTDADPINPLLNSKIPPTVLAQMNSLNTKVKTNFSTYTPSGMGASNIALVNQIQAFTNSVAKVRQTVEAGYGLLKNKLPFAVLLVGNLITPNDWKAGAKIEGISTAVDRINNIIKTPGRLLSQGIDQLNKFVLKLPKLPSLSKLLNAFVPGLPAISNVVSRLKAAVTTVKSVVSTAQQALAPVVNVVNQVRAGVDSVLGTINTETQKITSIANSAQQAKTAVQDLNKVVNKGNVATTLKYQSNSALTGLNNNSAVIINTQVKNIKGNTAITKVNTFKSPSN